MTDYKKTDLIRIPYTIDLVKEMLDYDQVDESKQSLTRRICSILTGEPRVPSSPFATQNLQDILLDSSSGLDEITAAILLDPGLTAKCLSLANSPIHSTGEEITNLNIALTRIGLREVRQFCIFHSLQDAFHHFSDAIDWQDFWFKSILSGKLMESVCSNFRKLDGSEYLIGLLHDIGLVIFWEYFPFDYDKVREMKKSGIMSHHAEYEVFGVTHAQISSVLARRWHFTAPVWRAIDKHHTPFSGKQKQGEWDLSVAMYLVNRLIETHYGNTREGYSNTDEMEQCMEWGWLCSKVEKGRLLFDVDKEVLETNLLISSLSYSS